MRKQIEALEYHTGMFAHFVQICFRITHIGAVYHNLTGIRAFQGIQAAQKGTFSGAGRPYHTDNFLRTDITADTAQHMNIAEFFL